MRIWIFLLIVKRRKDQILNRRTARRHFPPMGVKFLLLSMGWISLTCASSVPASWLAARWAEEADAELGLGWAVQQQCLAVLHDVGTHLESQDNTSQVTNNQYSRLWIQDSQYIVSVPLFSPSLLYKCTYMYNRYMIKKKKPSRYTQLHLKTIFCPTCCMATSISSRLSAESAGEAISACFSSRSRSLPARRPSSDRQRR